MLTLIKHNYFNSSLETALGFFSATSLSVTTWILFAPPSSSKFCFSSSTETSFLFNLSAKGAAFSFNGATFSPTFEVKFAL